MQLKFGTWIASKERQTKQDELLSPLYRIFYLPVSINVTIIFKILFIKVMILEMIYLSDITIN